MFAKQCLAPRLSRTFASQTQLPVSALTNETEASLNLSHLKGPPPITLPTPGLITSATPELYTLDHPVLATHHRWPEIEPSRYALYSAKYMDAPLRRDILHRAVVYEADMTRQGTASTKWRGDVHGSNRKLYAQKGTGRARVRDKKSPIRRGGGVAFGPKPRDFSTELPAKIYQQAFRVALSYRLRRNELVILDNDIFLPEDNGPQFLSNFFEANRWGAGHGRSLLVTKATEQPDFRMMDAMASIGEHGELKDTNDVDVKDLLTGGRIVIERHALLNLLNESNVFKRRGGLSTAGVRSLSVPDQIVQYL